ncbi:acetoin utilization protein [Actibacterium mucosum KCTC 23349]|uniref:Acetoin utilization protein n=1 Tax=Actibacterium mucosum KCTC 23349 TaxID=1454373 RepID=A0A037ZMW0_9RHOB|nr:class II histone deacetylase [Actibacterium mucosum]KAJ56181.1 acetoin utilization protein [Actibacterium mucosum KCTC 23349]
MSAGFFTDERCFWHGGGNYAGTMPVGGLVQPLTAGGLPEGPEAKRRALSMMQVTGLAGELAVQSAPPASRAELLRVHPASLLDAFKALSDGDGGELGLRAPFGPGGYEIAALSAGLATEALRRVLSGQLDSAYALCRPPGHHCTPDWQNGFCLINNIAVAVEAALAEGRAERIAVVDWDVHHGNGTEACFIDRPEVLTISIHQDRNYPLDTGMAEVRGEGAGAGTNVNIPLPPGAGHVSYLEAIDRLVLPKLLAFQPDVIVIANGVDAGANDPLGRMLCTAETFGQMTMRLRDAADELCSGRLVATHEGGYSDTYAPFCTHRVVQEMARSNTAAADPLAATFDARQPDAGFNAFVSARIDDLVALHLDV